MLLAAGIGLLVLWVLIVFIFKITKAFIHIALIVAIVAIVLHFTRAR